MADRRLTDQAVEAVFLDVPPDLPASPDLPWVREVAGRLRARGVRVEALGSATGWIDRPADACAWAEAALANGLVDGLHLDVEPWAHPGWDSDRDRVVVAYLRLLEETTSLARAVGSRVHVDTAWWLHEVRVGAACLDDELARRVDGTVVMAYRREPLGPDGIVAVAGHALHAADRAGVACRVAVETRDLGPGPVARRQTFHGTGRGVLEAALTIVEPALATHASYAGTAVHDSAGWADLGA